MSVGEIYWGSGIPVWMGRGSPYEEESGGTRAWGPQVNPLGPGSGNMGPSCG